MNQDISFSPCKIHQPLVLGEPCVQRYLELVATEKKSSGKIYYTQAQGVPFLLECH